MRKFADLAQHLENARGQFWPTILSTRYKSSTYSESSTIVIVVVVVVPVFLVSLVLSLNNARNYARGPRLMIVAADASEIPNVQNALLHNGTPQGRLVGLAVSWHS